MRFSGLKILKEGLTGNKGWTSHWRDPEPKQKYDILKLAAEGMACPLHIIWQKITV